MDTSLPMNALSLLAMCNEYCASLENAEEAEKDDFIREMLRLLPRIYIAVTDVPNEDTVESYFGEAGYLNPVLEEDYYESVRRSIEILLGEDDAYLEVFEEDMKYSDAPIGASISEGLADIFQVLYNLLENVKDSTNEHTLLCISLVKEEFENFWSATLCNVLRALNHIRYNN